MSPEANTLKRVFIKAEKSDLTAYIVLTMKLRTCSSVLAISIHDGATGLQTNTHVYKVTEDAATVWPRWSTDREIRQHHQNNSRNNNSLTHAHKYSWQIARYQMFFFFFCFLEKKSFDSRAFLKKIF